MDSELLPPPPPPPPPIDSTVTSLASPVPSPISSSSSIRSPSSSTTVRTLHVSKFYDHVSARDIGLVFEEYGQLEKVHLFPNRSGPYAFVEFRKEEDMLTVLKDYKEGKKLGNADICGYERGIHIEISRSRKTDERYDRFEKRLKSDNGDGSRDESRDRSRGRDIDQNSGKKRGTRKGMRFKRRVSSSSRDRDEVVDPGDVDVDV